MSLSVRQNNFTIVPQNMTEAMNFADLIAKSSFCPPSMKNKGGDVLIAMQMGAEIGLSPMQSLQNIAVINGKPTLWGDAALAVVLGHSAYVSHEEWLEGSIEKGDLTAFCSITRKNSEPYIKSFSMQDAQKAGLWDKVGPWKQYPKRMLQMRARAFAIRDKFADALRGINIAEEVQDYDVKSSKNDKSSRNVVEINKKSREIIDVEPVISNSITERDIQQDLLDISWCNTLDELHNVYADSYKYWISLRHQENVKLVIDAKDRKKKEIEDAAETIVEVQS